MTAPVPTGAPLPGDLWRRYRDTADPAARRQLLELYIGLVHHVAREIGRRARAVELDDLVSAGTFGLIRALDSFDLSRGLAFSTYAVRRIRGAILDDLRTRDWAPRAVRIKARRLQVAATALECRLGRTPRPEEVAAHLDIDLSTYWKWRDESAPRSTVSYEGDTLGRSGGCVALQEVLEDGGAEAPADQLSRLEETATLRDAIGRLPEKERVVMALYYYEELNQRQIAEVMHLTESRVSQIRSQALRRLKGRLVPAGGTG